ncbi:MAG: pentapeptide repeat-containing protein [Pleurocapsa sp.]
MNKFIVVLIIILYLFITDFGFKKALAQEESITYLTENILQEHLANLAQSEGRQTIDLSNYIIDLTNPDNEFSNQFYQQIKARLVRDRLPISLDLSNCIIQGNFDFTRLVISTPLTEGALSSLLTPIEREQIKNYRQLREQSQFQIPTVNIWRGILKLDRTVFTGTADFANILFLQNVSAKETNFQQLIQFSGSYFNKNIDFSNTIFSVNANFDRLRFLDDAEFNQVQFQGVANFQHNYYEGKADFSKAVFSQVADFSSGIFLNPANFSQTQWRDRAIFSKSKFLDFLVFNNATFEKNLAFRDIYVASLIDFKDANLLNRVDFSNAFFTSLAKINAAGLAFDSEEVKIIGESGVIGHVITVDNYEGNETILRNLIHNFRHLEQIADANQIEYQREKLKLQQLGDHIMTTPWKSIFSFTWIGEILTWLGLSLLLLLGDYGTNINLILSIGIITIAFFSLLFWLIDRYRPGISKPIIPSRYETICMVSSYLTLTLFGIVNIFITTDKPWLTLACLAIILLPLPITFLVRLFWQPRYHKLLDITYFVEDGSLRQFRFLFGRLPIIPKFPFFRDRYQPILWKKRWNWLNYYDFSFNNILKFGFNDIRLRDQHLPGIIATLVWYQWCLGGLYIVLLLWTLSRTIPGLNLLIYF